MEVILLEKVENLGNIGDQVSVKPGYGRNFLLPQGKATVATPENIAIFEARRAELEAAAADELAAAKARAAKLEGMVLNITAKSGPEGKLFGSLGTVDIAEAASAVFSQSDLDQAPLPVHQTPPAITAAMKQRAPGSVVVIFEVDQTGRVQNPRVRSSSDPIFESAVLTAIKQWRFEPGKRNGEPVRTRMLQPFTILR